MEGKEFTFEAFKKVIQVLDPCMKNYLYVFDLVKDRYFISPKALERFTVPACEFSDVNRMHGEFVYPDDLPALQADLARVISGEQDGHDITYRWKGRDGKPIWINCRGRCLYGDEGKALFLVGCVNEVGERAIADNVSGLLESVVVSKSMDQLHKTPGFVLRLGIDDFRVINEKMGMEYGDSVLRGVADCIVDALNDRQRAYRVVADEYLVVDDAAGTAEDARQLYKRIRENVDRLIEKNNYETIYTISGGVISGADLAHMDYSEMMKISQFALGEAKERGKNQLYVFALADYEGFLRRRRIQVAMRKSVSHDFEGFELHFQPIMKSGAPELYAAESLLRFTMPDGERISPVEFIPILEESGMIIVVGRWILDRAMAMCAECKKNVPEFKVSVNLSYVQILKSDIYDDIVASLERYGLAPQSMIVEMTESGYVETTESVRCLWRKLREYGVLIAIDDFGTGYSNFSSISALMPNIIKIDRGFTVKALQNIYEYQLMEHIIQLVHSVDLKICIEGIETNDELTAIEKLSADCIQGFYYGKPCAREEFLHTFVTS